MSGCGTFYKLEHLAVCGWMVDMPTRLTVEATQMHSFYNKKTNKLWKPRELHQSIKLLGIRIGAQNCHRDVIVPRLNRLTKLPSPWIKSPCWVLNVKLIPQYQPEMMLCDSWSGAFEILNAFAAPFTFTFTFSNSPIAFQPLTAYQPNFRRLKWINYKWKTNVSIRKYRIILI